MFNFVKYSTRLLQSGKQNYYGDAETAAQPFLPPKDTKDELADDLSVSRAKKCTWHLPVAYVMCFAGGILATLLAAWVEHRFFPTTFTTKNLGPIPAFPLLEKSFEPNHLFEGGSETADDAWDRLIPPNSALFVPGAKEKWGLKPGVPPVFDYSLPSDEFYSVAAIHQIHCLNMIRKGYWGSSNSNSSEEAVQKHSKGHVEHCFEYLRQSLMCLGDTTIENRDIIESTATSGWHVQRKCYDYKALYDYHVDQQRLFNETVLPSLRNANQ
ncbi:hypothetical protein B0J12DRAFT_664594 [Macrophomina phaseolina]|uniref:Uncharacterized protein n=1 Tax=Macrophomina phaseolina TaxID=35725 RepID=A0ABQ8GCI4_9PEZI|nr:hypothetical protein B0J12DRAFT_664594 [Macrophomina phaseolina]